MKLWYLLRETFSNLTKARFSSLLSIVTMAISLLMIGVFAVVALNGWQLVQHIKNKIEMEAFIEDTLTPNQIYELKQKISKMEGVMAVAFISKEEAREQFQRQFGEDVFTILGENPLPCSFRLRVQPLFQKPRRVKILAQKIQALPGVTEVVYRYELLILIEKYLKIALGIALLLGLIVGVGAILLIANTIQLSIYSKRDAIEIMKLVGATPSFIRRPFLLAGAFQGLVAGGVATGILNLLLFVIRYFVPEIQFFIQQVFLLLIVTGIMLGIIGSRLAIRRYLK
ncbi:hypothetical protein DRQ15_01565 [candidate division KSB1 bacterium]|nr:MAG: hypothetical protein DRQ15_01565 [candidate division KSB1 bacterium]